jgi:dTMP kinase
LSFLGEDPTVSDYYHRSVLIAIEGIDGAGKTTQVNLLRDALERVEPVVTSKEPTNGPWGRIIKESATAGRLSPEDELTAFLNDRTEHVTNLVRPALEQGRIVILDRYFYSSIAYQGSRGANYKEVQSMMEARFPIPDAVFILDIDPVLSVHRIAHSRGEEPNHFEERKNLAKAREIFNEMSGQVIHHIDGSMSREAVHSKILDRLIEGALKAKRCSKTYGCDDPFHCAYRITQDCEWLRLAQVLRSPESVIV